MAELEVAGSEDDPALVDDSLASMQRYRWRLDKQGYVMRKAGGKRIYLHHVVLPGNRYPDFVRDHINRDKLDNRGCNLRWVTRAESPQNRGACRKNSLGLRGVMAIGRRYRATATVNGRIHRFGMFDDPYEAAKVCADWRRRHMPFAAEG